MVTLLEVLPLAAIGLTALLYGLLARLSPGAQDTEDLGVDHSRNSTVSRKLVASALLLFGAFEILLIQGPRGLAWFFVATVIAIAYWYFDRKWPMRWSLALGSAFLVLLTLGVLLAQQITVIGEDQWIDLAAALEIGKTGSASAAGSLEGGYYAPGPPLPMLTWTTSQVANVSLFAVYGIFAILIPILLLAFSWLAVSNLAPKLTVASMFVLLLSTPQWSPWLVLHSTVSLTLASMAIYILVRHERSSPLGLSAGMRVAFLPTSFAVVLFHPIGVAIILGVLVSLRASLWRTLPFGLKLIPQLAMKIPTTTLIVFAAAYWMYTTILAYVVTGVASPFWYLLSNPANPSYRIPLSVEFRSPLDSLAWAMVPAAAAAVFLHCIRRRSVVLATYAKPIRSRAWVMVLFLVASFLLILAFGVTLQSGTEGGFQRYLGVPAYWLFLPLAVPAIQLVRYGKRIGRAALVTVVTVVVALTMTYTWAPDANPFLGATTETDFRSAQTLSVILPAGSRVAAVKEVGAPLFGLGYFTDRDFDHIFELYLPVVLKRNPLSAFSPGAVQCGEYVVLEDDVSVPRNHTMNVFYRTGNLVGMTPGLEC